jgi:hypothetical protein
VNNELNKEIFMEIREGFWKIWGKFVGVLIGILILWIALIFVCDKVFGKSFEELKYIHYFIFLVVILKAKKWFLKELDIESEDKKVEENGERENEQ